MTFILDPLSFDFMQQAVVMAVVLTVAASVLSCFLVLRGWALMGDAISHAVLPGIVVAYAIGIPIVIGAFVAGLFCSVATGYLSENSRLMEDTVMGVVFSGMFALGILLFSLLHIDIHLDQILFGDILGLSWTDVTNTSIIVLTVCSLILIKRKDLLVLAFDPQHARPIGVSVSLLHYGLLIMLSIVIVAGLKAVGIILIIALLIAPGAIAHLLTERFDHMLAVAVAVGIVCASVGVIASFHLDSAPAPTIVLALMCVFVVTFLLAPTHGLVTRSLA
ncbi:MAG: metal ABC transporter permease, partial [Pseudomonadota bacterium]